MEPAATAYYSVIICTHNRARYLEMAADSVLSLGPVPGKTCELIIIDNNSTDETATVAAAIARKAETASNWQGRVVREPEQGVAASRNAGIAAAVGEWLIFFDDDCVVPRTWLRRLDAHIRAHAPDAIGGPYRGAFAPFEPPNAFDAAYEVRLGDSFHLRAGWDDQWLHLPRLSGGNMAVRRTAAAQVGRFSTSLGMRGREIDYGEETEFQSRLLTQAGARLYFAADLEVTHFIRPEKTSLSWGAKSARKRAQSVCALRAARGTMPSRLEAVATTVWRGLAIVGRLSAACVQSLAGRRSLRSALLSEVHGGALESVLTSALMLTRRGAAKRAAAKMVSAQKKTRD